MSNQEKKIPMEITLRKAGLQKTAQRLAVLGILDQAETPLTADDIFRRLRDEQKVNRTTVYRILSSYTRNGIILEFVSKKGTHYYERMEPDESPHPHFNCRHCGVMICLTGNPGSWEKLVDHSDLEVECINISGLCHLCKANGEK
jgi:Fe2+ or Zn2+ uptake regulation protein